MRGDGPERIADVLLGRPFFYAGGAHYDAPPGGRWSLVKFFDFLLTDFFFHGRISYLKMGGFVMSDRFRNFSTIIYPESAPSDFIDRISDLHVKGFLSPLHDRDDKKPHYHLLLMYDGKKSVDQVKSDFLIFGGVGCEVVKSGKGYARYLCHLDDRDKAQYSVDDVKCFGGADYISFIRDASSKLDILTDIMDFCDLYDVYSFYALVNYSRKHRPDWFSYLSESSVFVREWLKSREWSKQSGRGQIIDPDTGEILS